LLDLWEPQDPGFWKAFRSGKVPVPKRSVENFPREVPFLGAGLSDSESRRLPWADTNALAAREVLASKQDYLTGLKNALERPSFRIPIRFEDGMHALLPHLQMMRSDVELLMLAVHAHLADGNLDRALEDLVLIFRIAELLNDEPLLISQLVKLACYRLALDAIESLCSYADLDIALIERLDALIAGIRFEEQDLERGLTWERAMTLPFFDLQAGELLERPYQLESDPSWGDRLGMGIAMTLYKVSGLPKADLRFLLESYERAISIAGHDWPEKVREMRELATQIEKSTSTFPPKIFSGTYLSSFAGASVGAPTPEGWERTDG
jgi:hypothetical protein